ncbi:MAG TPA: FHA domain-containing protein [Ktedonobacteraceae bacterium]|nr:FHA domain-containing protein [Ktedonobacteraceae bacterium]
MAQEYTSPAYLLIQQGPQAGKRVELWKDCTTIGRSRNCDIFLEDLAVHRKQASIWHTDAGYVLRDEHGSGDCFVNEQPVREQLLVDGDRLQFGNTLLIFFAHEGTRPFQLASSRGRELHIGKQPDPSGSAIAKLNLTGRRGVIVRSFELLPEMTIGRSRECDIFLEDLAVSRLHATIRQLPDGGYEIEDHRSATGTFVNGMPITRYQLLEGDVVQIGTSRLVFKRSTS